MRADIRYEGSLIQNITNPEAKEIVEKTKTVVDRAEEDT